MVFAVLIYGEDSGLCQGLPGPATVLAMDSSLLVVDGDDLTLPYYL